MANAFDQFDQGPSAAATMEAPDANPFDKFETQPAAGNPFDQFGHPGPKDPEPSPGLTAGETLKAAGEGAMQGVDVIVPAVLRGGFTAAGAVAGLAAGPGGVPLGAAGGAGIGEHLAQDYEQARGLRAAHDDKAVLKGMATTGVAFAAPGAAISENILANVGKQALRTGAITATAEGAGQLATGERDLGKVATAGTLGVLLGAIGGAVQSVNLTAARRRQLIDYARQFDFKGSTWADLRAWWQAKQADLARPVAPAAAEPAATVPAPRGLGEGAPAPVEPVPVPAPPPPVAKVGETAPLAPAAVAGPLPAPQGASPTVSAILDNPGDTGRLSPVAPRVASAVATPALEYPSHYKAPVPFLDSLGSTAQALAYRSERIQNTKRVMAEQIALSDAQAARLYDLVSRDRSTRQFERTLTPEQRVKLEAFFEGPLNQRDGPLEDWIVDGDKNDLPELAKSDDKAHLSDLVVKVLGNIGNPPMFEASDRFLTPVMAINRLREIGGSWRDIMTAIENKTQRMQAGHDAPELQRAYAEAIKGFADKYGLQLPLETVPPASGLPAAPVPTLKAAEISPEDMPPAPARGTSAVGDPLGAAGMPPIPPGVPSATLNDGRMPVAMERTTPGTVDAPAVLDALRQVAAAAGSQTAIREGRFYQQARGIAKSWEEVIRLRELNNLPTAAHEIGHIVSKALFGSMQSKPLMAVVGDKAVIAELRAMGRALYGGPRPVAGYTAEGFAELVRRWLSTDDTAKVAPLATRWLETKVMAGNPPLAAAMRQARQLYELWRGQGAEGRLSAQTKPEPGRIARVRDWAKANLSKQAVVEEFSPLEELATAYNVVTGKRLPADRNPFLIASALRGTAGAKLQTWVEIGMTNLAGTITGPPLREAYAPLKARDADKFQLYLTALEAIERIKQGKNPGLEREDVLYVRDKYQREHPEFVAAAEGVANWWDGVLQYKRDAYPEMNDPVIDRVRAANPRYYGPLARVLDPATVRRAAAAGVGGGLQAFKGSGRPIKQIILQSLRVAENMIAGAHRDLALASVINLAQTEGMGWVVEEVPRSRVMQSVSLSLIKSQLEEMGVDTNGLPDDTLLEYASFRDTPAGSDPIIAVRTAAGPKWYQIPAQVFEILQGVQEPARLGPLFELFAGMPNRAFKLGTTGVRASFSLITNPLRDLPSFMLQSISGNPAQRVQTYLGAMFNIVRAGLGGQTAPALELVHQLGLQSSTFLGGDIEQARREARGLFHGRLFKRIASPIETLRELFSFTETGPRLAELTMTARELGWRPGQPLTLEQALRMMVAFKRVTVDFSAKGSGWRPLYRATPFLGAGTQGIRSFTRAFKQEQGTKARQRAALRVILNGLTLLTLPALYNWWRNKDEEWYQQLPWRERYLYLNVAQGGNVYQIPMVPEWGSAFVTVPIALLDAWHHQDPSGLNAALGHVFSVVNPLDYPVLAKLAKEQWQNRIDFFNRPIVPRGQLDLMPGAQRSEYTSQLAQELGDIFPGQISPRRVDAAIRQVFGGVGADVATAPDEFMRLLGLTPAAGAPREFEPADVPVLGRLARRGGKFSALSQPLIDFWDDYTRYTAWAATNTKAMRERTPVLTPMSNDQRAYAARLAAIEPFIKLRMEMAARTPDNAKRQAIYRAAAAKARDLLKHRPNP